jgi:hypothetical protein
MAQAAPQTIFEKLLIRLIANIGGRRQFMSENDLFVISMFDEAKKLKNANFDEHIALLAMLHTECGNHAEALRNARLWHERNPQTPDVIENLIILGRKLLKPSVVRLVLPDYTEKPNLFSGELCLNIMVLGFYKHFISALEALGKAGKPLQDSGMQDYARVAILLRDSGISEEKSTKIIECVGDVLEKHHLCWHDGMPDYTTQDGEVGAWFKVDVSPVRAAELDVELADALITNGLDTEPFFVSFVGTAQ